jgi:uncharacterized membrane protein HdeD (DUF308 family)
VTVSWWWFLILGVLWTGLGMFVLSYRVGSLAVVAALVGVAFQFGGIAQLVVASRVQSRRWLFIVSGILAVAAGIGTLVWPGVTLYVVSILVAWYLIVFGIVHLIGALAGPKLAWWWTGLLLGAAELVLGVWAVHSWQRSNLVLKPLAGRQRPGRSNNHPVPESRRVRQPASRSFPSGHAASAFAFATAMGQAVPSLRLPVYVAAATVAIRGCTRVCTTRRMSPSGQSSVACAVGRRGGWPPACPDMP